MRTWIPLLLLLVGVAFAQDDMPQPETPAAPVDEWAVQKPESNPTGDPVQLKLALEPGWAHRIEQDMTGDMNTAMGPMNMAMGMNFLVKVMKKHENGEADYEMPIDFTKMMMNGQDMLPMIAGMLQNPTVTGRLDPDGRVVEGSMQMEGMGMMGQQMGDQMANVLAKLPKQAVRKGEVWEMPVEEFAKGMGNVKGGETTGAIYQKLEDIVVEGDSKVAVVKTVFSIKIAGDNLQAQGMAGKGEVKMKGESLMHFGLDGYLRRDKIDFKMDMEIDPGGMKLKTDAKMNVKVTGGKERFDTEPAAPEAPK